MIALGQPSHHKGGPILGRSYIPTKERTLMAKAISKWIGLSEDRPSGTYIRPHGHGLQGYSYGRWSRQFLGHYRFDHLGSAATVEACKEALAEADRAAERHSAALNKRRKRR
jgi:hypothetical protein